MSFEKVKTLIVMYVRLVKIADEIILNDGFNQENIRKYKNLRSYINDIRMGQSGDNEGKG